jgi:hypothetical protein
LKTSKDYWPEPRTASARFSAQFSPSSQAILSLQGSLAFLLALFELIAGSKMTPLEIIEYVEQHFEGTLAKQSWGETALFYNPGQQLPNGVYFCTLKLKDGANDTASNLNREGVFRLSLGLPPAEYETLFGPRPARPAKGQAVNLAYDFTALNHLMPHPVYAWMAWVNILNPSAEKFAELEPLLRAAYSKAKAKFEKKLAV